MKKHIILTASLLLTACFGGESDVVSLDSIQSARSGVRVSMEFIEIAQAEESQPAVIAGTKAGLALSDIESTNGTLPKPIDTGIPDNKVKEDTELLETLIKLLATDVQNLLNRSPNREVALENYIKTIESHVQKGHIRLLSLRNREEDLRDDTKRLERSSKDIRDELDSAINEGRASSVSALTNQLVARQTELAEARADLSVTSRILEALEEIIEPLGERIDAIKLNREPLIKGVHVIDIPGVDDLKIIETEDGVPRIRRKSSRGIF